MWLAGVIDCEGWIGVLKSARSNGVAYCGRVGVGNTNKILIDKLKDLTGVGLCKFSKRPAPAKDIYYWDVSRRSEVDDVLTTIQPYLLLKREQAELLLSLPPLHAKDGDARKAISYRLSVLNKKGR